MRWGGGQRKSWGRREQYPLRDSRQRNHDSDTVITFFWVPVSPPEIHCCWYEPRLPHSGTVLNLKELEFLKD